MCILAIPENIVYIISGLGIVQGLFLTLLIYFHPKSDRSVNIFLALYVLCFCIILTIPFILETFTWQNSFIAEPFPLLLGPFLYLYTRSFKEKITWQKAMPHLLFFAVYFFIAYWYHTYLQKKYADTKDITGEMMKNPLAIFFALLKIGWYILYYFLIRRTLHLYQRSIRQLFSETSRIDLNWAKWLKNGTIILILITAVIYGFMFIYPVQYSLLLFINMAIVTPYLYIVAYKGITQSTLWQNSGMSKQVIKAEMRNAQTIELDKSNGEKQRVQKSGLNKEKIDAIVSKITLAMEREKLYQETELNLQHLSQKLEYPAHYVSQAINEGMNKNFYDLINSYRVEEAKRLLLDPRNNNYTILSIGFEAGFNSKTTFNTVFKKFAGVTPTEFRSQQVAVRVPS